MAKLKIVIIKKESIEIVKKKRNAKLKIETTVSTTTTTKIKH